MFDEQVQNFEVKYYMNKKMWPFIIGSLIIIILLPLIIDWLVIGNDFPSNISNTDWVGFFGGYVGALIGSIVSLFGILWTINFTREQNRADRELQIRPYLDIRCVPFSNKIAEKVSWLGYVTINEYNNNEAELQDVGRGLLYLKNVGNGPATNIDIEVFVENIKVKHSARFNNQNTKVTSNSIQQGEESTISFMILNNGIAPSKDELIWDKEYGIASWDHTKFQIPCAYNIRIILSYNDLLGNRFTQELKFNTTYGMNYDKENGGRYCCDLHLVEIGVPQKQ